MTGLDTLAEFCVALDERHVAYQLTVISPERGVMVTVATPGRRWEIEVLPDAVEVEVFVSDGEIADWTGSLLELAETLGA